VGSTSFDERKPKTGVFEMKRDATDYAMSWIKEDRNEIR
jgi:hypothetical protein